MTTFALIDCNNFYASCERVFNPALDGKPIVVLSNNDGCIVARSNEAKQIGIPMGAPFFEWRLLCQKNKVHVFSSNYELYGDMSHRVMATLKEFCNQIEIYSIDEAFLILDGFTESALMTYAEHIKKSIKTWTGIPVCIGIGPTKTLAKIANHIAKKHTSTGVFNLSDQSIQEQKLAQFNIEDIWGIGKQYEKRLKLLNIHTAKELRDANICMIRDQFGVVMERTIKELHGHPCLPLETFKPRKQIMTSRSFGKKVTALAELEEAIGYYTSTACQKMRKQQSLANGIYVFLQTDHTHHTSYSFPTPTNDTPDIMQLAKECLRKLYKPGMRYKKAGIMLLDLIPETTKQFELFNEVAESKNGIMMKAIDSINEKLGKNTVFYCGEGIQKEWQIRCDRRSPRYTTRWDELAIVK